MLVELFQSLIVKLAQGGADYLILAQTTGVPKRFW